MGRVVRSEEVLRKFPHAVQRDSVRRYGAFGVLQGDGRKGMAGESAAVVVGGRRAVAAAADRRRLGAAVGKRDTRSGRESRQRRADGADGGGGGVGSRRRERGGHGVGASARRPEQTSSGRGRAGPAAHRVTVRSPAFGRKRAITRHSARRRDYEHYRRRARSSERKGAMGRNASLRSAFLVPDRQWRDRR